MQVLPHLYPMTADFRERNLWTPSSPGKQEGRCGSSQKLRQKRNLRACVMQKYICMYVRQCAWTMACMNFSTHSCTQVAIDVYFVYACTPTSTYLVQQRTSKQVTDDIYMYACSSNLSACKHLRP